MTVLVYSGYANSGKSKVVNVALERLGYTALSNSGVLHEFTKRMFKSLFDIEIDQQDKSGLLTLSAEFFSVNTQELYGSTLEHTRRELLKKVAEEMIVPTFSRRVFAEQTAQKAIDIVNGGGLVSIETIGGEEANLTLDYLESKGVDYTCFNVRSNLELPDADYRELIPGALEVWNNVTETSTLEEGIEAITLFINNIQSPFVLQMEIF